MTIDTSSQSSVQRIWLVRHGQTEWNEQQRFCSTTNIPLSASGRRQARHLASQLQARPITAIYSSDLARAKETAEIIARTFNRNKSRETARVSPTYNTRQRVRETARVSLSPGIDPSLTVITSPAWREIVFGAWEGLTYSEIAATFPGQLGFFIDPEHIAPPEGETLREVLERSHPALVSVVRQGHSGEIVIVNHGGVLRALLCSLLGMPLNNQWQFRIDTGSLSAIDVSLAENGDVFTSLVGLNMQWIR